MPHISLENVDERELAPGVRVKFIHSDTMTVAYWNITAGSEIPLHDHPHEQIMSLIEGEMEFVLDGETRRCSPGDCATIPSGASHSGKAITDCRVIDVFHPVREDYK